MKPSPSTMPTHNDFTRLLELLKESFGEHLIHAAVQLPNQLLLSVETEYFAQGAILIYNNSLFNAHYLTLLAVDEETQFSLYLLLLLKKPGIVVTLKTVVRGDTPNYPALSPTIVAADWHEREIHDLFGIVPEDGNLRPLVLHRDWPRGELYPMRHTFSEQTDIPAREMPHQFDMPEGAGRHQVAVGPIHAGIIEPGHMRFSVTGERIHQFDAQLFYTHKGIEKMAEGKSYQEVLTLAEHVCGLCAFSHSLAFTQAIEALGKIEVPERAISIRAILLEMERLASHLADLSAICSAGGFGFASARAAYFRELILQLNDDLTGHRFLRNINQVGGLKHDISDEVFKLASKTLQTLSLQFEEWRDLVLATDSFLDRVEDSGFLSAQDAKSLGLTGPAARGSGLDTDMRVDFPYGVHTRLPVSVKVFDQGDVFARMSVRIAELEESMTQSQELISALEPGPHAVTSDTVFPVHQPTFSIVESAKGSLIHWIIMGADNRIYRWHIRSAPYMNWRGVVHATMGNNIVPDGPLINKSFNLCYACVDR